MSGAEPSGLTAQVDCGGGAVMTIIAPQSFDDSGLEWALRYGDAESVRYTAASVVESYDYLCGPEITTAEAVKRLRTMRRVRTILSRAGSSNP